MRVVDPCAVERHHRIGDRTVAALDEAFLLAVGVQEHQVGAGLEHDRAGEVGEEALVNLVPGPASTDVDDVVVVLDTLVGRNVRNVDVDRIEVELFLLLPRERQAEAGEENGEERQGEAAGHREFSGAGAVGKRGQNCIVTDRRRRSSE